MKRNKEFYSSPKVYKELSFRMSSKKMADIMYAILMTQAELTSSIHFGAEYTRKQNAYNEAHLHIHIREIAIPEFEELTGIKLKNPPRVQINMI
jgi:hypothetical protein